MLFASYLLISTRKLQKSFIVRYIILSKTDVNLKKKT